MTLFGWIGIIVSWVLAAAWIIDLLCVNAILARQVRESEAQANEWARKHNELLRACSGLESDARKVQAHEELLRGFGGGSF